jgi:hypothetical protein
MVVVCPVEYLLATRSREPSLLGPAVDNTILHRVSGSTGGTTYRMGMLRIVSSICQELRGSVSSLLNAWDVASYVYLLTYIQMDMASSVEGMCTAPAIAVEVWFRDQ